MLNQSTQHATGITLLIAYAALIAISGNAYGNSNATEQLDTPLSAATGNTYAEGTEVSSYVTDAVITGKVKAAILHDPELTSYEIRVETDNGRVMLSGQVDTQAEIDRAGDLALGIKEVRAVINYMKVNNVQ